MNRKPLLIRPIPYVDESAASLLIRAAGGNGYQSVHLMISKSKFYDSGSANSDITQCERFASILKRLGLSTEYENLAFSRKSPTKVSPRKYLQAYIPDFLFRRDARSFCPQCLKEAPYWRRLWLLRPYTVCLKHQILLHDRCFNCKKELGVTRSNISLCNHCGSDLRSITCLSANPDAVEWFLDLLNIGDQETFNMFSDYWLAVEKFDWLPNKIESDHSRVAMSYQYFIDQSKSIETLTTLLNQRLTQAHPQIQVVHFRKRNKIFHSYIDAALSRCGAFNVPAPDHYQQYFSLAETCAILQISHFRLQNLIKKNAIDVEYLPNHFAVISSIKIEQVLLKGSHQEYLKAPRGQSMTKGDLLTIQDIASRLNVHKEMVRSLAVKNWLKMEKMKVDGYVQYVATPVAVSDYENQYIMVGTLARFLRVNSTNLADKLRHFGIEPIGGPHIDGLKTNLYNKSDVNHINTNIISNLKIFKTYTGRPSKERAKLMHYESDPTLYRSLSYAAQKLSISPSKVAVLVQKQILKKDHNCHTTIKIEKASLFALLKELQREDLITLQDAAKQLNCAQNWLHINWIKTGYLKLYDYEYWQFVKKSDVDKVKTIQTEYMTASEASSLLGMHRTHVVNLQKQGLISPIELKISQKVNFYRREDVMHLAKRGYIKSVNDASVLQESTNE